MSESLRGSIESIIFRNEENGYTVFSLSPIQTNEAQSSFFSEEEVTAVGNLPALHPGEQVELFGHWVEHRSYGTQFQFDHCETLLPDEEDAIEKFLAGGFIKGIGPATARNIVRRFGGETLTVIEQSPHLLAQVKGISTHKAQMISESYQEQVGTRNILMRLQSFGLTTHQSLSLAKQYGNQAEVVLKENPYRMIQDLPGIGFKSADKIAQQMGLAPDAPQRIEAGLYYALQLAANDGGHTCLPAQALCEHTSELLEMSYSQIQEQLENLLLLNSMIVLEIDGQEMIALPRLYQYESSCAKKTIALHSDIEEEAAFDLHQELAALERESKIQLDEIQRQAILSAFSSGVTLITGGPGTGKTTIVHFILLLMQKIGLSCELCAPTGRAAKRMSETTGQEARTIHRMLEYTGQSFQRDEENPLDCEVLIADEMSMVDIPLFYRLLCAISPGTRLILVGDIDQLPSVGPGNVLKDLIRSELFPTVRLSKIFRQEGLSRIVENAHRINHGEMPLLDFCDSFAYESIQSQQRILDRILGMCKRGILGDLWNNLQILSPTKKGLLGVNNLNERLQALMNPADGKKREIVHKSKTFREGDKVLQIKNDYSIEWTRPVSKGIESGVGVFNGDIATIGQIDRQNDLVELLFDDKRRAYYEYADLDNIDFAYAISIHKSQGSEFPIVLMPVFNGPPMLMTRNLLYTAVTRAKDRVVMLGQHQAIEHMVSNAQERKRYSCLKQCIWSLAPLYEIPLPEAAVAESYASNELP